MKWLLYFLPVIGSAFYLFGAGYLAGSSGFAGVILGIPLGAYLCWHLNNESKEGNRDIDSRNIWERFK